MSIQSEVRRCYVARWGEPSREARFNVDSFSIEIYKWDESVNREGVTIYATNGASTWPIRGRAANHRLEFFVGLSPEEDGIASPLAALGLYAIRENTDVDHGHTVPAGQPLWSGTQMKSFLVMRPRIAFLAPLEVGGEVHVHFLQAIPIFESERMFNAERGIAALLDRWEKKKMPFWRADRLPEPPSSDSLRKEQ